MTAQTVSGRRRMLYTETTMANAGMLNARLLARYRTLLAAGRMRQTHHFGGRYENTYIEADDIPDIRPVLDLFLQQTGRLLDRPPGNLRAGFWFNAMKPGHTTSLHHHDENDELMSGVYYVEVPQYAGELVLHDGEERVVVQPRAGKLVLFAPSVLHEVTPHRGSGLRLSIGMNAGPARA